MNARIRVLYQEVKASTLGRIAFLAALLVPISSWVIVTRMEPALLVRWPLTILATAAWMVARPLLPAELRTGDLENLRTWQLALALPAFFVIATLIAGIVAAIRRRLAHSTASSVIVGYLVALAILQLIGVAPWIVLAWMFSQIGPY
jgi:hypothetical protein